MPLTGSFTGVGISPTVSSAQATTSTTVRVTFSEGMKNNAALSNPASYTLTPAIGSTARAITVVTPQGVTDPTYVDLTLDGAMTTGILNYTITVSSSLEDAAGNPMDVGGLSDVFDGLGVAGAAAVTPTVITAAATIFNDTSRQNSRQEVLDRMTIDGRPFIVSLVYNPTIDDVVISEARIIAHEISSGEAAQARRVERPLRDYLIRLSVER